MELADRVAVIFEGHLAQYDAPDALYQRPNSIKIADFMGATNIFNAKVDASGQAQTSFTTLKLGPDEIGQGSRNASVILRSEVIDLLLTAEVAPPTIHLLASLRPASFSAQQSTIRSPVVRRKSS